MKEKILGKKQDILQKYTLDKKEMGKVMLVASITLFIVSVHSVFILQNASSQASSLYDSLEKTDAIISSQDFNQSIDALEDTQGTRLAPRFMTAADAFRSAQNTTEKAEKLEADLNSDTQVYQWTALVSILGTVSGALLIYI